MYTQTPQLATKRRPGRFIRVVCRLVFLIACLILIPYPAHGQNGSVQTHPTLPQALGQSANNDADFSREANDQNERLLRVLNLQRQKAMVNDANKLLRLVNEFNAEIARTSPSALTPDQLRKLAEIEKLARNVREKMATSVRGTQPFEPPFQPIHN
jgi:hypothetical protein